MTSNPSDADQAALGAAVELMMIQDALAETHQRVGERLALLSDHLRELTRRLRAGEPVDLTPLVIASQRMDEALAATKEQG